VVSGSKNERDRPQFKKLMEAQGEQIRLLQNIIREEMKKAQGGHKGESKE